MSFTHKQKSMFIAREVSQNFFLIFCINIWSKSLDIYIKKLDIIHQTFNENNILWRFNEI